MNPTIDFASFTFLVIDDDEMSLEAVISMLEILGSKKVLRAESGATALKAINEWQKPIDCILCDYQMPNGNGLQFLQYIRTGQSKHVRPDICFIMLTASGDPATVYTAAHLDVSGYIVKPASVEKLRQAIEKGRSKYIKLDIGKYRDFTVT